MSIDIDYSNRQLIPRLLPVRTANILSLNEKSRNNENNLNDFEQANYIKLKTEWLLSPDITIAINILSYEIFFSDLSITKEVINFLQKNMKELNIIESDILNIAVQKHNNTAIETACCEEHIRAEVELKSLKVQSRIELYNPIVWCDIGYYYTVLGQNKKAERAYRTAISINNSNAFIVRSVSRFFLHNGDPEIAHKVLASSKNLKTDPRLISAEIALSELMEKKSKYVKRGIALSQNEDIHILEKNELLSQLASLEFSYGKNSKGRKLVELCLSNPNENSLAQFEFLSKKVDIDHGFSSNKYSVLCQYEALSRNHFANMEFNKAFQETLHWHQFQPFSSKPAILASYIASTVLGKHNESIRVTESALKVSPDDPTLLNNYAFSLANVGKNNEALSTLSKIKLHLLPDDEKIAVMTTLGFIKIKLGDVESGKGLYKNAIKYFDKRGHDVYSARASHFYSKAISKIDRKESNEYLDKSIMLSKKNNITELNYLHNI